jgi:vitamin B12 transporter
VARDVNKRKEDLATLKFDYDVTENVGLYLKGYYHRWHTNYDTTYNDLQSPGDKIVLYDNAFWGYDDRGINALARIAPGKGVEYYVGYDLQRYGGRDEVLRIVQNKETTQALFAQVRTTPELLPNTHLSAGVRYNDPDVGEAATIWNVGAQYDLTQNLFVRVNGGTNFRLPSAEELFADDPLDERGNPNLKPERTKSVNLSVGGKVESATLSYHWEVIGYAREIDNLIDYADFDPVTEQAIFGNIPGTVKVRGGEIVIGAESRDAWSTELSYSRNRSRQDGGDQIARVPESLAKATFDWHPSALPFGATLTLNYTGDTTTPVGPALAHYGDYFLTDLSGRYFLGAQRQHRLVVSLQNVFDKEYGRPSRGCKDDPADGPYDCSLPYTYVNLGLPRTLRASYSYTF